MAAGVWELALKVSQVQGGVSEPGAAAAFERPLASRRARSDALSERDELRPARVNLPRGDTAWHLSAFDTATCDEGEAIGRPAGGGAGADGRSHGAAAVSSAVYRLSHQPALQTQPNLQPQSHRPRLLPAQVGLKLPGVCVCTC